MNILPTFKIDIVKGRIIPESESDFSFFLQSMEGKKETSKHLKGFLLSIKPFRGKRSWEHNKFYWKVIVPVLCEEMGMKSRWDAHEELVWLMFPNGAERTRENYKGEIIKFQERKHTSKMSVREFTEFVEWCKDFGALEFGIIWENYIDSTEDNK